MSIPDPFYKLIKRPIRNLSKGESLLLEAILFINIYEGLKEFFKEQQKQQYRLISTLSKMEDFMLEDDFVILIIKDILATGEYSLEGIAYYTDTHIDVIQEIILKYNSHPSLKFLRKLIELHRSVRNNLYEEIIKKFIYDNEPAHTISNPLPLDES